MTKYKNDPTDDHDYEPSAYDKFWLSQDDQSDEAKDYVNELEKKIREAKIDLQELHLSKDMTYQKNLINNIINNLK